MSKVAQRRLQKDYLSLVANPIDFFVAKPNERNIFEWHYILYGPPDSPYAGGTYHGKLIFPNDYPYKPPSIIMCTTNGRFQTNTRLCLSISDFHPESWNPLWSVGSILNGLLSFMLSDEFTTGSISTSPTVKKRLAELSMKENVKNHVFAKMFPDITKTYKDKLKEEQERCNSNPKLVDQNLGKLDQNKTSGGKGRDREYQLYLAAIVLLLGALMVRYFVK